MKSPEAHSGLCQNLRGSVFWKLLTVFIAPNEFLPVIIN